MRSSTDRRFSAACRFGHVAAAGGIVRRRAATDVGQTFRPDRPVQIVEFVIPSTGEVVARRVHVGDQDEYWLRADLDDLAARSLEDEAALYARVAAEVVGWSREADQRRADAAGLSLQEFRTQRNFRLQRIDQKRGRNSVGI